MLRLVTDPALTDTPTLVLYIGRHEWYYWIKNRRIKRLYYRNGHYVKGTHYHDL